jgi:glutamate synthase (NADPH/NADH) small chain
MPLEAGRHVIGGGDTGADCLGTAHRQGAARHALDYNPEPPEYRDESRSPWPMWPMVLRTSPAHAEGGARHYEVAVQRFVGDDNGNVRCEIAEVHVTRVPTVAGRSPRRRGHGNSCGLPCCFGLTASSAALLSEPDWI